MAVIIELSVIIYKPLYGVCQEKDLGHVHLGKTHVIDGNIICNRQSIGINMRRNDDYNCGEMDVTHCPGLRHAVAVCSATA
jgi:hypothetical protein